MSGEAIYRGYDRAALDAQYNNRARIPEYVDYFERWLVWSAETREALPGGRDIAYGDLPVETLDIFPAERHDAPILIMIHGG
ncbi:MAG: alpha/beta hydrolase, partial [Rhodospirillales bacterium]|nr:alpha/beta hydrolase [Rhodospirillales bacterium]